MNLSSVFSGTSRRPTAVAAATVAALALAAAPIAVNAQTSPPPDATVPASLKAPPNAEVALYTAMRTLWEQHMEWTYATVTAFFWNASQFQVTSDRLMQNQVDIGNAIKPYYGDAAGTALTKLLKQHITDIEIVAEDAETSAPKPILDAAIAAAYQNADMIGEFLASANPYWPAAYVSRMLRVHITQTLRYAYDLKEGKYADGIKAYGRAEHHMDTFANVLSAGIINAFPQKFVTRS